jgi:hypothetical protein
MTDASLELLHQILHFVSITGKRKINFAIEAVILVLIALVIEFAALLCRRECLTLTFVPVYAQRCPLKFLKHIWRKCATIWLKSALPTTNLHTIRRFAEIGVARS